MRGLITLALALFAAQALAGAVVLYEDRAVTVENTLADPTDLWVRSAELSRVNGFELKPEGACIDDICVPVRQDVDSDIFVTRQGTQWFNDSELADRLNQPMVVDSDNGVWSFGAIPARRSSFVNQAVAPDFSLPDIDGNTIKLSDFKGKKIMLLTWASW
jgi:hypothetical protein